MDPTLFYDTETTGLPDWKTPSGGDNQPHIIQLAAALYDMESDKIVSSINLIVRPDGWEIPEETIELHGITPAIAMEVGIPEEEFVRMFLKLWSGRPRVCHNRTFDQRIIRIACKRYEPDDIIEAWAEKETHECTMLASTAICKIPGKNGKGGYKWPTLEEAYEYFTGRKLEGAHNAANDVRACYEVYKHMKAGTREHVEVVK